MKPQFKIGDLVRIKTTDVVGMVISITTHIKDTGVSIQYEVTYPNMNNDPVGSLFSAVELEKIEDKGKFGFGGTE